MIDLENVKDDLVKVKLLFEDVELLDNIISDLTKSLKESSDKNGEVFVSIGSCDAIFLPAKDVAAPFAKAITASRERKLKELCTASNLQTRHIRTIITREESEGE